MVPEGSSRFQKDHAFVCLVSDKYLTPTRSSRSESVRPYVCMYVCTPLLEMLIKMLHDGHKCKIELCLKVPIQVKKDQEGSKS